ncbi:hypothetical protein P885DRAFT_37972 [Corynascus similis CBS 632.67]
MDDTARESGQTPRPETTLNESSLQLTSGTKRPTSETTVGGDGDSPRSGQEPVGDAGLPSPKRFKAGPSITEADEAVDSRLDAPAQSPEEDTATIQRTSKGAHGGWNGGITSGLRTSFATKDKLRKPLSRQVSKSPVQPVSGSIDIDSLAMPSAGNHLSKAVRKSAWQARFTKWCVRLMALNRSQEGLKDDPALLREAWGLWLETKGSLPRASRTAAMEAAKNTHLDAEKLQAMFSEALESDLQSPWDASSPESGQAESVVSDQQSNGRSESVKSTPSGVHDEWVLPPPLSCEEFDVRHKDQRGWEERFLTWCKSLIQLNERKIKVDTVRERNRLAEAYLRWVGTIDGLSKAKAAAARRTATHYAQDNSALLTALFASTPPGSGLETTKSVSPTRDESAPSSMIAVSNDIGDEIGDEPGDESAGLLEERVAAYRNKYFPGVGSNETFCHLCASRDHDATECPETACRFCRDPEHRSFSCPTRRRCTKCKQLGHQKEDCKEKLALPPDEVECVFCQSRDHVDASCHEIWRSFKINPATVRKVRLLPVFCYCCGHEGHYGSVCGLNPQKTKEGSWETWSQANCDRYQDSTSSEVAVVYEATSAGSGLRSERPDLGKSIVPQRHIFFEDTDDDDEAEEFIRPPVQKSTRIGHINFPSSNRGANQNSRRPSKQYTGNDRNGRPGYAQPPLPPGPPPPLPPQSHPANGRNSGRRRGGGGRY